MWDTIGVEWVRGRKPKVGKSLDPSSTHGGRRIENLWKPTCEAMWVPQSCRDLLSHVDKQEKGTWEPGSIALVGFDSLPEFLSWLLSVWTGATMIDGHGTERGQKRNDTEEQWWDRNHLWWISKRECEWFSVTIRNRRWPLIKTGHPQVSPR